MPKPLDWGVTDTDDRCDEDDMERGSEVEAEVEVESTHRQGRDEKQTKSYRKVAMAIGNKFEFKSAEGKMMRCDGSNEQTGKDYIARSIGKNQNLFITNQGETTEVIGYVPDRMSEHLMKSQKQNSNNVQGDSSGPSSPLISKRQTQGEVSKPFCQDCLDEGGDWATNMGLEEGYSLHDSEMERENEGRLSEKVCEQQSCKRDLVRTETSSIENSFWQGFESESGQLKDWMGRREVRSKKQRVKRMRSCSVVYKNSRRVIQPSMEGICNKLKKNRKLEELMSRFCSGDQNQVVNESIADSGNEDEVLQKLNAMEERDKEQYRKAAAKAAGLRALWGSDNFEWVAQPSKDWGPKPFCFFDAWIEFPGFKDMVGEVWESTAVNGWNGYRLKEKLKETKRVLKVWSKDTMSEIDLNIQRNIDSIANIDIKEEDWQRPVLGGIDFKKLSVEEGAMLEEPFNEEEIKKVVWSCESSKAPGPDGFNFKFIKVMWEVLKEDIMGFVNDFHKHATISHGLFEGIEIGYCGMKVSHLQFVDDTILFGKASEKNIWAAKCIIRVFEIVSRLKINFEKSSLMGINVSDEWRTKMATILHCKQGVLPCRYLGVPIRGKCRSIAVWRPIIESFRKKLASWKNKFISLGGRITLLNSVLSSLPVFTMAVHLLPKGKSKTISQMGYWNNESWTWSLCWRRPIFSWEEEQMSELWSLIQSPKPIKDRRDRWEWKHDNGSYSVKSGCYALSRKALKTQTLYFFTTMLHIQCGLNASNGEGLP
ncbi:hypothetical protein SLEP1_g49141 [Rubroshorea leprosula]|uniref:Uncharacterized protein n=1 Tax=Rubroshorea leprosula TaxID=152421 RepID=A0AAV5LW02_9ROSI|nr:hypothetical protein SLEP1_g49141 [Rubroshorea leprosula]